jgi:hypothetical protein
MSGCPSDDLHDHEQEASVLRTSGVIVLWLGVASVGLGGELSIKLNPVEPEKVPFVAPVVAPAATCCAIHDALSLIAFGQKAGKDPQLSLFRLDAAGKPAAAPVVVKLPKPATLAARECYPLSMMFHPSLPLLYVWQEVEGLKGDPVPPIDPAWKDLDHLLIYAVDGAAPELLLSLCRGPQFHTGQIAGTLCVDAANGKLYVPNLRFGDKNPPASGGVGWFNLGGDGLPVAGDDEPAKAEPTVAAAKAAADRPARLAALRAAIAAAKPIGAFRHTPDGAYGFGAPGGAGFAPISRDVFVAAGYLGLVTWNLADRRAQAQYFLMPHNFVTYYCTRLAAHPRLPVFYATMVGYSYANCVEHIDGSPTLAPQVLTMEGTVLKTLPVVVTKRNFVAWGTETAIYLAPINAEGKFKKEDGMQVNFPASLVQALAYSERFDRLYVGVEKIK